MYGYNTGIVAGISKPAILGFFNSTFLDKETESCVQIENKPGAMSASTSPSSMAALEGLFVSDHYGVHTRFQLLPKADPKTP